MGTTRARNSTTFKRCPKNKEHPFTRMPSHLFKLDGYQVAIMGYIISNSDTWIIVKSEIKNRTKFPRNKFNKAWKSLEDLGYIKKSQIQGGWDYTIIEDLNFTDTTDSKCESSTLTTGRQCTGGILTTIKNNNNNTDESFVQPIDKSENMVAITKSDKEDLLHNQFLELKNLYPNEVIRSNGSKDYLKTGNKRCEMLYTTYLMEGLLTHSEVMDCLKVELNNRGQSGKMKYIKKFVNWLNTREFEAYKELTVEPVSMGYGTELMQ
jgi:hypothetical protein